MALESAITKSIMEYLQKQGFYVLKMHGGPYMKVGIPDLIIMLNGRVWFAEIKRPGERPTPSQLAEHRLIERKGCSVVVLRSLAEAKLCATIWLAVASP